MSSAGVPKDRRRALEKEPSGQLWEGKVDTAVQRLHGAMEWVRNTRAVEDLIGYLEKRREFIPDYQERRRAGLWIASTRVEKFNDWAVSGRCKHQGMSWTPQGVLALAAWKRRGAMGNWTIGVRIAKLVRWTPKTGQLGGLDLLWPSPANRLAPGPIDLARGQ